MVDLEAGMRVKRRCLVALAVLASTLMPLAAQAQDARIQELERKLQERDKVILELLDRVEALERRVGIEHAAYVSLVL